MARLNLVLNLRKGGNFQVVPFENGNFLVKLENVVFRLGGMANQEICHFGGLLQV